MFLINSNHSEFGTRISPYFTYEETESERSLVTYAKVEVEPGSEPQQSNSQKSMPFIPLYLGSLQGPNPDLYITHGDPPGQTQNTVKMPTQVKWKLRGAFQSLWDALTPITLPSPNAQALPCPTHTPCAVTSANGLLWAQP